KTCAKPSDAHGALLLNNHGNGAGTPSIGFSTSPSLYDLAPVSALKSTRPRNHVFVDLPSLLIRSSTSVISTRYQDGGRTALWRKSSSEYLTFIFCSFSDFCCLLLFFDCWFYPLIV